MSHFTRRQSLGMLAAVSIPPTAAVAVAGVAPAAMALPAASITENPALVEAYERFLGAREELASAKDALEWLADEWRHLWPLAPEEILDGANADRGAASQAVAEKDILGRFIHRDTAPLTKRLTRSMRNESPRLCFSIYTPERIRERIAFFERPFQSRRPKALSKGGVARLERLAELHVMLPLSREYWAETARIREASGVERVKSRVHAAEAQVRQAAQAVSSVNAKTPSGLRMKAEAMKEDTFFHAFAKQGGLLGDMARFIDEVLAVAGEAV